MRRSACLVGVFVLVLSLCARRVHRRHGDRSRGSSKTRPGRCCPARRSKRGVPLSSACRRRSRMRTGSIGFRAAARGVSGDLDAQRVPDVARREHSAAARADSQGRLRDGGGGAVGVGPGDAESPIIDVKQNASTLSIQSDLIDLIPKGRDFTQVVNSAPARSRRAGAAAS